MPVSTIARKAARFRTECLLDELSARSDGMVKVFLLSRSEMEKLGEYGNGLNGNVEVANRKEYATLINY